MLFVGFSLDRAAGWHAAKAIEVVGGVVAPIGGADVANIEEQRIVVRQGVRLWIESVDVAIGDRQAGIPGLAHHPLQRNVVETKVAVAATDVGVHTAKPDFARARESSWNERRTPFVEGQGVEAVLDVSSRHRQLVTEVQRLVAEEPKTKRGNDIPHADESNLRMLLDDQVGIIWILDAAPLQQMA